MRHSAIRLFLGLFCPLVMAVCIAGCNSDLPSPQNSPIPTSAPTSPGGNGISGNGSSSSGFYVSPTFPAQNQVAYYFHEQSSLTKTCSISATEPVLANKDIYCILDAAELDLYYSGVQLNFNIPPGMCPYIRLRQYSYYAFQPPNAWPLSITASVHKDINGNVIASSVTPPADGHFDAAGAFHCTWDYSAQSGDPNCCEGQVTLTTLQDSASGTSSTSSTNALGGLYSNCLFGPAVDDPYGKDKEGFPFALISNVYANGASGNMNIASPISKTLGTNLYIANYYPPTDFSSSNFPTSTFPSAILPTGAPFYSPYHEFACMDVANDYIARIRVFVRSWDTVAGFNADSNPYTAGTEPQFGGPWHDRSVWQDYESTFPGYI